ncbi:MAG: bifunctional 5,10-methylene-tetrahydrofolate dehydrogenase/5,10-methylene-tetrahydrofolate cyclohydrolase [Ignavibacteriae bacterium]|nr:bifunctional 5,10-methylene-tetrahydrofolate dehydrogenase/5,10-methylene-tetrahydrofolate cyclohydrolase [Ignavibacteriota bacterium]
MTQIIDGKLISKQIKEELKEKSKILLNEKGITPGLALLLVGDNPASKSYVASKEKFCAELGFKSVVLRLPEDSNEEVVLSYINSWNSDSSIHGILVQLPLPKHINEANIIQSISPKKDVDGFHPESFGRLVIGLPGFIPCTPAGIAELIKRYKIETKGKHVVVVGRSNIVGKPIANLMYQKNADANSIVTICHTAAPDLRYYTKQADILIAAVGVPKIIKAEDVKEGVVIIDVGINRIDDASSEKGYRIVGDVDFDSVKEKASAITPVPGGVGLMTVAMLMLNTYKSASGEIS